MFSRLHDRFGGAALVVAIVAMVAALAGGAYAASGGGLTAKQKKEVQKIAKGFQGKGPQGATGATGANGKDGANGSNGNNGNNGKSVTVEEIEAGEPECDERGGALVKQEGAGSGTEVCNGDEGSPWTAGGTLPSNATETGVWAFGELPAGAVPSPAAGLRVPISFTIPLGAPLATNKVHYLNPAGKELLYNEVSEEVEEISSPPACPGSIASPKATSGNFCVYAKILTNAAMISNIGLIINPSTTANGAGASGAVLKFANVTAGATGFGTWAVTG